MVERSLSMREVQGSIPCISIHLLKRRKHPRWGSNPQPPAPGTDALPLRHAGLAQNRGHAGARTQDLRLIRATLYRLSYTTPGAPGRRTQVVTGLAC